jgi:hypothetical protein
MAKRIRKTTLTDDWKAKIQATQLINRLMSGAMGEVDLTSVQVNAAKVLLSKVIPDLKSTDMQLSGKENAPAFNFTINHVKPDRD